MSDDCIQVDIGGVTIDAAAFTSRLERTAGPSTRFGAWVTFFGAVRASNRGKTVVAVEYDAFEPLAVRVLTAIAEEARAKWNRHGPLKIVMVHRTGRLRVGETSVAIGVLAPHRAEAYEASRYVIEELKVRAPIWKREETDDGMTEWLKGHALCSHGQVQAPVDLGALVVLAGGASRRMGVDKRFLVVGGRSWLDRARSLGEVGFGGGTWISGRVPGQLCLPDAVEGLGPIGGITTVLQMLGQRGVRRATFVPVDALDLSSDDVARLARDQAACSAFAVGGELLELPFSVDVSKTSISAAQQVSTGSRRVSDFLASLGVSRHERAALPLNLNTPAQAFHEGLLVPASAEIRS